ncbi:MAG TPA: helix-hairpin-helix domain-containing protein [Chitinophagales bacterium]|nr:helix-hairpin-helix domain-containing protein [Chitinophagales bacterium]
MTNIEIAQHFALLADLMELHNENPFKIKSYEFAGRTLKKINEPLANLSVEQLEEIDGVGKAIAAKIFHLTRNGKLDLLEKYLEITPPGVVDLLQIKGIGPKKIAHLWKELEIESVGELEYACLENRLVELKGFGKKTQDAILEQIRFFNQSANKYLWSNLEELANEILLEIQTQYPDILVSTCGDFRRKAIILERIDFLIANEDITVQRKISEKYNEFPVQIEFCNKHDFYFKLLQLSSDKEHFGFLSYKIDAAKEYTSEKQIYEDANLPFIVPELRDNKLEWKLAEANKLDDLIELQDIKGVVHSHSHYSDGTNSLKDLAVYCKEQGFEYLVISDHSKSAFYAQGMKEDKITEQHEEIEKLNKQLFPFKIYKSIESDILNDGNLDYETSVLKTFDLIIASVHSQLKMPEEKAMHRLIKAIENPFTTILGHMTGRLLLSRPGYPVNHKKIIDACAANNVCIELNANPYRLDIDYNWINYCQEKNVLISINPDAHNLRGVHDIKYGVYAARKGGLLKENTLNALTKDNFEKYISTKHH